MKRYACRFTLVELMVVISIIAILAAIAVPATGFAMKRAMSTKCVNNQRQIMTAIQAEIDASNGRFVSGNSNEISGNETVGWARRLVLRRHLSDTKLLRCPAMVYSSPEMDAAAVKRNTNDTDTQNFFKETYGVIFKNVNLSAPHTVSDASFDFRGSKYLRFKDNSDSDKIREISPSQLIIGGDVCADSDSKNGRTPFFTVDFTDNTVNNTATATHSVPYAVHSDGGNFFFFDGHVATIANPDENSGREWCDFYSCASDEEISRSLSGEYNEEFGDESGTTDWR